MAREFQYTVWRLRSSVRVTLLTYFTLLLFTLRDGVAVSAQQRSKSPYPEERSYANQLGRASLIVSVIGICIGLLTVVAVFVV